MSNWGLFQEHEIALTSENQLMCHINSYCILLIVILRQKLHIISIVSEKNNWQNLPLFHDKNPHKEFSCGAVG